MSRSLPTRASVKGMAVLKNLLSMSALNLFKAATQFGITALVALYVIPSRYGLVTFSLPIIQFIALFTDMGLASALIREPRLSERDAGAAMSFSLVVGGVAATLLALLAWPIERWSALEGLGPVLASLAAAVFMAIVAGVPRALLERMLAYHRVAAIEGGATIAAAIFCLAAVIEGAGIWGLVGFHLVLQSVRAVGFLLAARGRMRLHLRWGSVRGLLSFGGWVLATNLVNFFARNAQNILIGAWLGAAAVGLYGLAYQFMILPLMALAWPAGGVLMATLSRISGMNVGPTGAVASERYGAPVLAISTITAAIAFPLMTFIAFGLALPARELLSPHWAPLAPLLATLAPLGAIQALSSYNGAVLVARGKARVQFIVNAVSTAVLLIGFIGALPFGLSAFAWTYLVVGVVVAIGQIAVTIWAAGLSWQRYIQTLGPGLVSTVLSCSAALVISGVLSIDHWFGWIVATAAYAFGVAIGLFVTRGALLKAITALMDNKGPSDLAAAAATVEASQTPGGTVSPTLA